MYPKKSHRDDPRARRANYHLATPSTNDDQRGVGYTIPTNKLLYSHSPILQSPIHPHSLELNTNVSTRYPESSQRTQIGSIDFAPTHDTPEAVLSAHKNCEHVSYTAEMTASGSCYSSAPIPSDRPPPSNQPPFFYNPPPFPYSSSSANLNLDSGPYPLSGYPSHLRPFDTGSSGLLYSRECGDLNYQKQRQNGSDFIPIVPNFSESTVDYPFRAENSSVLGSSERSVRLSPDSPESISEISLSPGPTTGVLPQVAATARPSTSRRKTKQTRMHMCEICFKKFPRPSGLDTHMNSHYDRKPHECGFPGCPRTFSVRSNARRHFRTHPTGNLSSTPPSPPHQTVFKETTVATPPPTPPPSSLSSQRFNVRWVDTLPHGRRRAPHLPQTQTSPQTSPRAAVGHWDTDDDNYATSPILDTSSFPSKATFLTR